MDGHGNNFCGNRIFVGGTSCKQSFMQLGNCNILHIYKIFAMLAMLKCFLSNLPQIKNEIYCMKKVKF